MNKPLGTIVAGIVGIAIIAAVTEVLLDRYVFQPQSGSLYRMDRLSGEMVRVYESTWVPVARLQPPAPQPPLTPFDFSNDITLSALGFEGSPENKSREINVHTRARYRDGKLSYIHRLTLSKPPAGVSPLLLMSDEDVLLLLRKKNSIGVELVDDFGLTVGELDVRPGSTQRSIDENGKVAALSSQGSIVMSYTEAASIQRSFLSWSSEKLSK